MTDLINVEDLVKVYPDGTRAVDGVTFQVTSGEIFGFLGPNGAGKTTAIRVLVTLLQKTSGRALVGGHVYPLAEIRSSLGKEDNRLGRFELGEEQALLPSIAPPPLQQLQGRSRHSGIALLAPCLDPFADQVDQDDFEARRVVG